MWTTLSKNNRHHAGVYVDYEENYLVMLNRGGKDVVHVNYDLHRLVMIDLRDDDVVHVD